MTKRRRKTKGQLNRVGRRRRNLRIALFAIVVTLLGTTYYQLQSAGMVPANQTAEEWYEADRPPVELVSLPADDAPHDNYTEWWYYNGHLQAQDGKHYSFHYVIFVINRLAGHTVAHASLVDHQTGKHYTTQQRTAGKPNEQLKDGFDFHFGIWKMAGTNGTDQIAVDTNDFNLNLALENVNPPVLHGKTGLLDFKQAGTSYYYSRPRMRVTGTAGVGDDSQLVSGEAWFDHQWGDFRVTALAWNWFAIQLDDGRDLMLFELFTPEGQKVAHYGTLSGNEKPDVTLEEKDFEIEVTEHWLSETTRINYPMGWAISVPGQNIDLTLTPVVKNAEFDGRQSSYLIYWEGPAKVSGSQAGVGYIEMSGYQPRKAIDEAEPVNRDSVPPAPASEEQPDQKISAAIQGDALAREAVNRTIADPNSRVLERYPALLGEDWLGQPGVIGSDRTNVRAGPGTGYAVVASLSQGRPVRIVARSNDWVKVVLSIDQGQSIGWIHGDLVTEMSAR